MDSDLRASGGPRRFLLIVGAGKCGTTALFRQLSAHDQIAPCQKKEPNFFRDDEIFSRGLEWYRSLWDWDPETHSVAVEASVKYACRPRFGGVARRIAELRDAHDVEFSIVYIVRDPIERIESDITSSWNTRLGPSPDAESPLEGQPILVSAYAEQLRPFVDRFEDSLTVVQHRDLRTDPAGVLTDILGLVGLDPMLDREVLERDHNKSVEKYKPRGLWKLGLEMGLGGVVDWIPQPVRKRLRRAFGDPIEGKYRLTQDEEAFVRTLLSHDVKELEKEHEVDTSRWSRWNKNRSTE